MDFVLAERLGKTLSEVRAMPHAEYVEWMGWLQYQRHQQELAAAKSEVRNQVGRRPRSVRSR